jgi:hypothetical protein
MPELPSIATDTNVLLDLAEEDETVLDCFETLRRRLPGSRVMVLPTVIHELADIPYQALKLILDAADVPAPLIASPWKIVHQFFR